MKKKPGQGWIVKRIVEPKARLQNEWWARGANDVIASLIAWAKREDAKDAKEKGVKSRGSVLRNRKKKA